MLKYVWQCQRMKEIYSNHIFAQASQRSAQFFCFPALISASRSASSAYFSPSPPARPMSPSSKSTRRSNANDDKKAVQRFISMTWRKLRFRLCLSVDICRQLASLLENKCQQLPSTDPWPKKTCFLGTVGVSVLGRVSNRHSPCLWDLPQNVPLWSGSLIKCDVITCGVWSVQCGVWREKCGVRVRSLKCDERVEWEVWSEVWSGECEVWSVESD